MGYSQAWLAVKGKTRTTVLDALGLQPTGTREEIAESPVVGAELPSGWYLVVTGRSGYGLTRDSVLRKVSAGCEVVVGEVEEHVMVSIAAGWNDGHEVWSVVHDSQRGRQHLETKGTMPAAFAGIHDEFLSKQQEEGPKAKVDYIFEIPVELARSLTGYRHDATVPGTSGQPFEILTAPSFLKRLFGG